MSTFATIAICVLAVMKVAGFGFVVHRALHPPPIGRTDMDGPDGNWRWWEEFGPEPEPQSPGGNACPTPTIKLKKTRSGITG
jgi:hypothetical protein